MNKRTDFYTSNADYSDYLSEIFKSVNNTVDRICTLELDEAINRIHHLTQKLIQSVSEQTNSLYSDCFQEIAHVAQITSELNFSDIINKISTIDVTIRANCADWQTVFESMPEDAIVEIPVECKSESGKSEIKKAKLTKSDIIAILVALLQLLVWVADKIADSQSSIKERQLIEQQLEKQEEIVNALDAIYKEINSHASEVEPSDVQE